MKNLLLICSLFMSSLCIAQLPSNPKSGKISGKVIDAKSNEALPYVSVVIKDNVEKIMTGGISDENGEFIINQVPLGEATLEIQFMGYTTVSQKIELTTMYNELNIGTILLNENTTSLEEVTVVAETSTVTQKIDRKVINVGKDLQSAGTTASDLLNNVQSVSVDSQTGQISLRGNENVRVLVDGRPTNVNVAQLLKQLPSTAIKSVELITNPSAKYNPEGMSGIINIVLHKNASIGFNGNFDSGVTAGHYVRSNASTNVNFKTGKVNFFANYGYNGGDNLNYGFVERTDEYSSLQNFNIKVNNQSHLAKIGADIYINDKNTLSVYTTQNWYDGFVNGRVSILNNETLNFNAKNLQDYKVLNNTYNLNYSVNFNKEGHNLEFEATYSDVNSDEDADFNESLSPTNPFLNYENVLDDNRKNTILNLDYTNPISENGKLEIGAELRSDKAKNAIVTNQADVLNSAFQYDRDIYSGYINYGYNFDKIQMQIGARFEQYEINGNFENGDENATVTDEIFSIYPSAFITYSPTEKNQFQVSYSRRVDRPSIQQVNPIREWSTPLITSVGNPDLVPQFTNSYELNYTRKIENGSITFGTFYRRVNDNISRIINADPLDPTGVRQILSFTNFDGNDRYGFEVSLNYKIANWWRINASSDLYSQNEYGIANNENIEITNTVFNGRISNNFKVNENLRIQLFSMYRGANKGVQFNVEPMWMINTGASYTILKGKGTINLRFNDIFRGMKFQFNTENPYSQNGKFNWESQTTYLGFNYQFGSGKNKAKQRRQRDSNEVQGGGGII